MSLFFSILALITLIFRYPNFGDTANNVTVFIGLGMYTILVLGLATLAVVSRVLLG